jgi:hypothetical protein
MTLIHTALFAEAKPIIEKLRLQFVQKKPYRVYRNKNIILVISGIGKKTYILKDIIEEYNFKKAINIGIAGCRDKNITIGELFSTIDKLDNIPYGSITTVDKPIDNPKEIKTLLIDMESKYFLDLTKDIDKVYVFKIVSDYLDTTIPSKRFVWKIIENSLDKILYYL